MPLTKTISRRSLHWTGKYTSTATRLRQSKKSADSGNYRFTFFRGIPRLLKRACDATPYISCGRTAMSVWQIRAVSPNRSGHISRSATCVRLPRTVRTPLNEFIRGSSAPCPCIPDARIGNQCPAHFQLPRTPRCSICCPHRRDSYSSDERISLLCWSPFRLPPVYNHLVRSEKSL